MELGNSLSRDDLEDVWITNVALCVSIGKGGPLRQGVGEGEGVYGGKDGWGYDFFSAH